VRALEIANAGLRGPPTEGTVQPVAHGASGGWALTERALKSPVALVKAAAATAPGTAPIPRCSTATP
jgi:hypothetical protein